MTKCSVKGYVHSIQTLGTLDGPGIRFVIFTSGCLLRCIYCHNPDTQFQKSGTLEDSIELIEKIKRYQPYFGKSGGLTISGGEPLLQPDFVYDIFNRCRKENIHTALDTSGVGIKTQEKVLEVTDLVILDIKATGLEKYQSITDHRIDEYEKFKQILLKENKELWLRHVVVPNVNDTEEDAKNIASEMNQYKNVSKIEILPFTNIGSFKYKELNLPYTLYETKELSEEEANQYRQKLKKYLKQELKDKLVF